MMECPVERSVGQAPAFPSSPHGQTRRRQKMECCSAEDVNFVPRTYYAEEERIKEVHGISAYESETYREVPGRVQVFSVSKALKTRAILDAGQKQNCRC